MALWFFPGSPVIRPSNILSLYSHQTVIFLYADNIHFTLVLCAKPCFSCIIALISCIFTPLPIRIQHHSGGGIFVRFAQIIVTFSPISCASCTNTLHIVVMNNCTYYILCFLSHINNTETRSVSGLF